MKGSLELPGFSTLNAMASQLRGEVNAKMFERVAGRVSLAEARRLEALLDVVGLSRTTAFNRLKQSAGRASWSAFREQVAHMVWGGLPRRHRGVAGGDRRVQDRRFRRRGLGCGCRGHGRRRHP